MVMASPVGKCSSCGGTIYKGCTGNIAVHRCPPLMGCKRGDGGLNVHYKTETCEVCAPATEPTEGGGE